MQVISQRSSQTIKSFMKNQDVIGATYNREPLNVEFILFFNLDSFYAFGEQLLEKHLKNFQNCEFLCEFFPMRNLKILHRIFPQIEISSIFFLETKQEKLEEFLEKRERGELLVQKTARLFETFLAPTQLSARATFVEFGQAIQLIACNMPNIHSTTDSGPLTLSVVVNEPHINRCREIDQHCEISCAPSSRASVRNTFIVRKPLMPQPKQRQQCNINDATNSKITGTADNVSDCQYLKYGQDFMFECYESKQKPLMLYSSPQSPFAGGHSDFVFKTHGEMKQSVGLALQKAISSAGNFTDERRCIRDESSVPSKFFHWRFYHINPEMRYETIGENIPVRIHDNIISFIMALKPTVGARLEIYEDAKERQ